MDKFRYDLDGQGGFTGSSQDGTSQLRNPGTRRTITPITIKQLVEATQEVPDGDFVVNSLELNFVSIVAVVRKVENLNSSIAVGVEDGTGECEVRQWVNEQKSSPAEQEELLKKHLNKYVYIYGTIKEFGQKKNIQNPIIRAVEDSNQILYHYLGAINCHLKANGVFDNNKMSLPKDNTNNVAQDSSLFVKLSGGGLEDDVFNIITEFSPSLPEGVPCQLISTKLGISNDEVVEVLQSLMHSGRVFNGSGDDNYLPI
ncbi:replication factor A protein 2 [Scheffersomyces spartinae]|uniref:Replication factor A protein 2 n=1 Tax=Scheffersomyces spartinae TaxID=45513 RepID=A0A9P8AKA1_9ASCO|nr:replication factor A protein 2 [Scheffersomyces spartinae]KAG7195676.1 replication factor A protein 2 [Scheffersomyces spartinae]